MPTSSGAAKRAREADGETNFAKKKAVFDPKENTDTPKAAGKKQTAAQKRKAEAEAKAKASNVDFDADDEQQDSEAVPSMPDVASPVQTAPNTGHGPVPGTNPGPFITPGKTPAPQQNVTPPGTAATSPQPGPSGVQYGYPYQAPSVTSQPIYPQQASNQAPHPNPMLQPQQQQQQQQQGPVVIPPDATTPYPVRIQPVPWATTIHHHVSSEPGTTTTRTSCGIHYRYGLHHGTGRGPSQSPRHGNQS